MQLLPRSYQLVNLTYSRCRSPFAAHMQEFDQCNIILFALVLKATMPTRDGLMDFAFSHHPR